MHKNIAISALILCAVGLTACNNTADEEQTKTVVGVVDESNLNEIMLTVADPKEAVRYFQSATAKDPERDDLKLDLATSLVRAGRPDEASVIYQKLSNENKLSSQNRVDFAESLIRSNKWNEAAAELNRVPPNFETYQRYRLEAMVADSQKKWKKADSFYQTASGLTTQPASVLNNWGYSKLTRGDFKGAESLFLESITYDEASYTAKNNLVLARGSRRVYDLPVIPMTQIERAELTYTAALAAIKNGDKDIGRGLLEKAIDTHPRHFEDAVRSLKALKG